MLLVLGMFFTKSLHGLHVVQYLTLRTILSILSSLLITLLCGPMFIRYLSRYNIGQVVRNDGPQTHYTKKGTPTMGGVLLLVAIVATTLLWGNLSNRYIWITLIMMLGFGLVGWQDDYYKLLKQRSCGLSAWQKFFCQSILGLGGAIYLYCTTGSAQETALVIPFLKDLLLPLGPVFIILAYTVIVGASNAVNLTDGLDGLAIMPTVMIAAALGIFAYVSGNNHFANYLAIPYIPGSGELVVICGSLIGSGLGFLWFNTYPAEVFMGDVGSLALGATLGVLAVIVRQELVFFLMSGVFVLETVSVIIQVLSYKLTGKRIFRMAPIHHHFELLGWPEPRVIVRFWIVTFVLVLCGLATLKLR